MKEMKWNEWWNQEDEIKEEEEWNERNEKRKKWNEWWNQERMK